MESARRLSEGCCMGCAACNSAGWRRRSPSTTSQCTSSSISSRSMAAVPLGPDGVKAGLQGSQAGGVGGFDLLAQPFGFFLSPTQVIVYFGLVAEIVGQGAMNIGQGKGVQ